MSTVPEGGRLPLPPYLWIWLIIFIVTFPFNLNFLQILLSDIFSPVPLPGEEVLPFGFLLRLANCVELFPLLLIIIGVLSLAVPSIRQSYLQRKYGLTDEVQIPIILEASTFIRRYLPDISISNNPLRGDQVAFIYPVSFQKAGIGLMGGVGKLWKGDNESARGVLLHEIAHIQNGDTLITGAGSGFRTLFNYWPVLFIVTVAVPVFIVWVMTSYLAFAEISGLMPSGEVVTYKFEQFLLFFLPSLFFMLLTNLMWVASVIFLPLAALWYSELAADCVAARCQGTPAPLARALRLYSVPVSWWRWFLARMTHPPTRIRLFMLQRVSSPLSHMVLLILMFPVAMVVSMLFTVLYYASFDLSILWATQTPLSTTASIFPRVAGITAALLVFVGLGIMLWPSIVRFLDGFPCDEGDSSFLQWKRAHLGGGIMTLIMALLPGVLFV